MRKSRFLNIKFLEDAAIWLLNHISAIVGNYGLAIIVTTFLVRLLMFPLTIKQEKSMKKMRELQPKLDALKAKYKDDKETLNVKTMELYQQEKVNPAGGCLPVLIQLPIFIALYNAFISDSIPKHATFLWFNLANPDALFTLFGFTVNILPILTALVTIVQQKMMQPATNNGADDVAGSTMKTMTYMMPIFLLFIFYNMPSGLNLYYLVNSTLSVLQQMYVLSRRD